MAVQYIPPAGGGIVATGGAAPAPIIGPTGSIQGHVLVPKKKAYRPMKLIQLIDPVVQFTVALVAFRPGNPNGDEIQAAVNDIVVWQQRQYMWQAAGKAARLAVDGFDF